MHHRVVRSAGRHFTVSRVDVSTFAPSKGEGRVPGCGRSGERTLTCASRVLSATPTRHPADAFVSVWSVCAVSGRKPRVDTLTSSVCVTAHPPRRLLATTRRRRNWCRNILQPHFLWVEARAAALARLTGDQAVLVDIDRCRPRTILPVIEPARPLHKRVGVVRGTGFHLYPDVTRVICNDPATYHRSLDRRRHAPYER